MPEKYGAMGRIAEWIRARHKPGEGGGVLATHESTEGIMGDFVEAIDPTVVQDTEALPDADNVETEDISMDEEPLLPFGQGEPASVPESAAVMRNFGGSAQEYLPDDNGPGLLDDFEFGDEK